MNRKEIGCGRGLDWFILGWVHTCNVTAYRNAVTLQVTHTTRSYDLNFHPVPLGVTVSCKRYTRQVPVVQQAVVTCHIPRPHLLKL
jgi:hypothetical protein